MEHFVEWFRWRSVAMVISATLSCAVQSLLFVPMHMQYICCVLVNKDSLQVHLFWFAMVPAAGIEGQLSRVGFMPCFINVSLTTPKGNGVIPYWLCFNPAWTWRLIVGSYHIFTGKKGSILPMHPRWCRMGFPAVYRCIQHISQALETSEKPDMQSLQYAAEMH